MKNNGIDYFNRGHWLTSLQVRLSYQVRRRMYDLWHVSRPQRVLDVGTTPDLERMDSNCFLEWLQIDGHSVAVLSPEDLSGLSGKFPGLEFLPRMNGPLWPVPDSSYDWVFSSAVLEHVGPHADQSIFLKECARVGNGIFLTTPNRCHWLEFHTKLPLIHWLPKKIHRLILKGLGLHFWAQEKNLNLLTKKELTRIAHATLGAQFEFSVETVWALGMPSNLVLIARKKTISLNQ